MTVKKPIILALAVAVLAVLIGSPATAAEAEELFVTTYKCNMCHSVEGAGIAAKSEKMGGGDLTGYTTDDIAALAKYLSKEAPGEDGEEHKKAVKATDEELQTIVDWLGSLEASS